ncbi:MAG TPA: trypsin-like serine protease [Bryobacteraceae bacterium]|nr:trypsin-like serine protease [Bryobacteraceae bacterium]
MPIRKQPYDKPVDASLNFLNFIGERAKPSFPGEMQARPPIIGKGEPPADLIRLAQTREHYVRSASADAEPEVKLERVRDTEDRIWRVQISDASFDALPGRTAVRERPEKIVAEIDPKISFTGHRPDWAHSFHAPRVAADESERLMRRFNGRTTQPLYVFGADNRVPYQDSSWPWGLVGKVYNSDGKMGTGALIGKRLIATAGHMLPWNSIAQGSWWMKFVPAYYNGSSLFGAGVQSYVSDCKGYNTSGDVTGYDFAVCRLYTPLGDSLGYFGYNGYDDDWEDDPYWTLLGYPSAVASGQKPSYQSSIAVIDDDGDSNGGLEIESQGDMTPGNSGGPLFSWWNGDPRLIGVVSGQEEEYSFPFSTEKVNVVAGGSGFTNLMAWGRTNWPL